MYFALRASVVNNADMDNLNLFIKNVNYLMRIHNIDSAAELARLADLQQPTVHRILTGAVRDPRIANIQAIGRALGVPYWVLTELDCEQEEISKLDSSAWMQQQRKKLAATNHAADVLRLRKAIEVSIDSIRLYKGGALPTADEIARSAATIYNSSLSLSGTRSDETIDAIIQAAVSH